MYLDPRACFELGDRVQDASADHDPGADHDHHARVRAVRGPGRLTRYCSVNGYDSGYDTIR